MIPNTFPQELDGMLPHHRIAGVSQHARNLLDALVVGKHPNVRSRYAAPRTLGNDEVVAGARRYLRKVGDHQHLTRPAHFPERVGHTPANLCADPLIDLVEDERRYGIMSGQDDLEGQHQARELSPTGYLGDRSRIQARIELDEEGNRIGTCRRRPLRPPDVYRHSSIWHP